MTIVRSTPDVGYLSPEAFASLGLSQTVRAGDTCYLSGLVALNSERQVQGPGDAKTQIQFILTMMDRFLKHEGLGFDKLTSVVVYATDLKAVYEHIGLFSEAFRAAPPTMTMLEIKGLAHPDLLLEVVATAYCGN